MKFRDNWNNRPKITKEKPGGKKIVERGSYVPIGIQIKQMQIAGQNLDAIRAEQYASFNPNEVEISPLNGPGRDPVEVEEYVKTVQARLKAKIEAKRKAHAEKLAQEAEKKAQETAQRELAVKELEKKELGTTGQL